MEMKKMTFSLKIMLLFFYINWGCCTTPRKFDSLIINNILIGEKHIYLGGVNQILKLDYKDFGTLQTLSTGPMKDNRNCLPINSNYSDCIEYSKCLLCEFGLDTYDKTDNYNKILFTVKTPMPMLIACGTLFQGICQYLNPDTLKRLDSIYGSDIKDKTVTPQGYASANLYNESTVSFIMNDVPDNFTTMVVAKSRTFTHPLYGYKRIKMILLGKNKETLNRDFLQVNGEDIDYKNTNPPANNDWDVQYVSSFHIGNMGYFLFYQRKMFRETNPYISKIARVKIIEKSLKQYIEVGLSCKSDSIDYNMLLSASKVEMNGGGDSVVFATFGQTDGLSKRFTGKYAVCKFSIKEADQMFANGIKSCKPDDYVIWAEKPSCDPKVCCLLY